MKAINVLVVAALLTAFASSSALAADEVDPGKSDGSVPVQHLRFTEEEIQGGILDSDGTLIESVPAATHSSFIEIRQGFEAEIVKTMENF